MANNGEQNVPNAKDDFNKAAKNELEQKAQSEQAQIPASQVQIEQLEKQRPKPEYTQEFTPTGTITREVNAAENANRNAEIDRRQEEFRERMKAQQGKAREDFARANDKSNGR